MTDQPQPIAPDHNPRFETTIATLVKAGAALTNAAETYLKGGWPDSEAIPTPDVVRLLRDAGLPVSVRGDAPAGTVIPQRAIQRAARELSWLEADRRDIPAAEVLEALAGVGIPVRVGSEPAVSESELEGADDFVNFSISASSRTVIDAMGSFLGAVLPIAQAVATAAAGAERRTDAEQVRKSQIRPDDLAETPGKCGCPMCAPAEEDGARWDGEHDPAAEDAALAADASEREV